MLLSDYGKGVLTRKVIQAAIAAAKSVGGVKPRQLYMLLAMHTVVELLVFYPLAALVIASGLAD